MGFILEPKNGGEDFVMSGWNWRPTISLLERKGVVPHGERVERCLANGCGGFLSSEEAIRAADALDKVLATLNASQRVLRDGSITDKPIDYQKPVSDWTDDDTNNHYSAKYEVLIAFAKFCRTSGGFLVH